MALVSSDEYIRLGLKVNSEIEVIQTAVQAAMPKGYVPGAWWQNWMGFYGGWTQYYAENIVKPPVLPLQDTGDVDNYAKQADQWQAAFTKLESDAKLAESEKQFQGPAQSSLEDHSSVFDATMPSTSTLVKTGLIAAGVLVGGFYLFNKASR